MANNSEKFTVRYVWGLLNPLKQDGDFNGAISNLLRSSTDMSKLLRHIQLFNPNSNMLQNMGYPEEIEGILKKSVVVLSLFSEEELKNLGLNYNIEDDKNNEEIVKLLKKLLEQRCEPVHLSLFAKYIIHLQIVVIEKQERVVVMYVCNPKDYATIAYAFLLLINARLMLLNFHKVD